MTGTGVKSKFILKWKHGISDNADAAVKEDPVLVAQRLVNLYRCYQMMSPEEQANYIQNLKDAPDGIRTIFFKLTGGREVEAFYRFLRDGDITPIAVAEREEEAAAAAVAAATATVNSNGQKFVPPPPPPSF